MRIPLLIALLLSVPFAARGQGSAEQSLAWVEHADPDAMFAARTRFARTQFLTVCGYACYEPGIGVLTLGHCYARVASTIRIDSTGDVISSARQLALKTKAAQFAERWNTLVRQELDRRGRRKCGAAEEWDDYWIALRTVAEAIPAHPYESFVMAFPEPRGDQPDFQFHVQDEGDINPRLFARACELAPRFGLQRRVRFTVTSGNINDHPKRHRGFACVRGVVAV